MERAMGRVRRRRGALSDGPVRGGCIESLERVALHVVNEPRVGLMAELPHGVVRALTAGGRSHRDAAQRAAL